MTLYLQLPYLSRLAKFLKDTVPVVVTALGVLLMALISIIWGVYTEGRRRRLWR